MSFSDYKTSMKMRDIIEKAALNVIDRVRPRHRYAIVQTVNIATRRCEVKFIGEDNLIAVPFGASIPITGQRVRIAGVPGDFYVDDIIGKPLAEYIPTGGTAGDYLKKLSATDFDMSWLPDPGDKVITLSDNQLLESAHINDYPAAVSIMVISQSGDPNWPTGFGTVLTVKRSSVRARQIVFPHNTNDIWMRAAHNTWASGWSPWEALRTVVRPDDLSVLRNITAGNWYRIARIEGTDNGGWDRAVADFEISSVTSGIHDFLRFTAGFAYAGSSPTINLQDYTGYATNFPGISLIRIVAPNGTYGGAFLEFKAARTMAIRIQISHRNWPDGGMYWNPAWQSASANVVSPAAVRIQRGVFYTNSWFNVSFKNGWANYAGGYSAGTFTMLPGSLVKMSGLVRNGTIGTDPALSAICTLPEGCRVGATDMFSTVGGGNAIARIDARTDGNISVIAGNNSFITLAPVSYIAEG